MKRGPDYKICAHCGCAFHKKPQESYAGWSQRKYHNRKCFLDSKRAKPKKTYTAKDHEKLSRVCYYEEKLGVARSYGFYNLCDFIVDFDSRVGSIALLGEKLKMSRTGASVMLGKLGLMNGRGRGGCVRLAKQNLYEYEQAHSDMRQHQCVDFNAAPGARG